MPPTLTLADLNRMNQEFWDAQQQLLESQMVDTAIREIAFEVMRTMEAAERERRPQVLAASALKT